MLDGSWGGKADQRLRKSWRSWDQEGQSDVPRGGDTRQLGTRRIDEAARYVGGNGRGECDRDFAPICQVFGHTLSLLMRLSGTLAARAGCLVVMAARPWSDGGAPMAHTLGLSARCEPKTPERSAQA